MASLTTNIGVKIGAAYGNTLDLEAVASALAEDWTKALASGTGANAANKLFSDNRNLAASGSEELDLAGVLVDAFGATLTFTKVRLLAILAAAGNTNNVEVGGAAANAFPLFKDATDIYPIPPGGMLVMTAPDVNGKAVTAGTGDKLKIANSAGGTAVDYKIIIVGE